MPKAKTDETFDFGFVAPPARKGRTGTRIDDATADKLMGLLEDARADADHDGWIGTPTGYDTSGKAQSAARRFRRALVDHKFINDVKEVQTRVWQDGDNHFYALRLRAETPEPASA